MVEAYYARGSGAGAIACPTLQPRQFINPRASEARAGDVVIPAGRRLDYSSVALRCDHRRNSRACVPQSRTLRLLATGDEIVEPDRQPSIFRYAIPMCIPWRRKWREPEGRPAFSLWPKTKSEATRILIEHGLAADLLLLSGGVSAASTTWSKPCLPAWSGVFFDRVLISARQPLVFGRARASSSSACRQPASTMVTFELFGRAALELLGGQSESLLPITQAPLAADFRHKPGLTRFLPASLSADGLLSPVPWQGSSDVPRWLAPRLPGGRPGARTMEAGELIQVLLK